MLCLMTGLGQRRLQHQDLADQKGPRQMRAQVYNLHQGQGQQQPNKLQEEQPKKLNWQQINSSSSS
jgi:hypothetical protein